MRGFFLLLLLTNVAFFAWQITRPVDTRMPQPGDSIAMDRTGMILLHELPDEARPALRENGSEPERPIAQVLEQQEAVPEESVEKASAVCLRVSQIPDKAVLEELVTELNRVGVSNLRQGAEQGEKVNFMVMLPPYSSHKKALEAAALLERHRVRDFFIVRTGENQNAVSLGVFSTEERAQARYDQIARLKARLRKPQIEKLPLPVKQYWVSFRPTELTEAKGLVEAREGLRIEEIPCR